MTNANTAAAANTAVPAATIRDTVVMVSKSIDITAAAANTADNNNEEAITMTNANTAANTADPAATIAAGNGWTIVRDAAYSRIRVIIAADRRAALQPIAEANKWWYSHTTDSWHRRDSRKNADAAADLARLFTAADITAAARAEQPAAEAAADKAPDAAREIPADPAPDTFAAFVRDPRAAHFIAGAALYIKAPTGAPGVDAIYLHTYFTRSEYATDSQRRAEIIALYSRRNNRFCALNSYYIDSIDLTGLDTVACADLTESVKSAARAAIVAALDAVPHIVDDNARAEDAADIADRARYAIMTGQNTAAVYMHHVADFSVQLAAALADPDLTAHRLAAAVLTRNSSDVIRAYAYMRRVEAAAAALESDPVMTERRRLYNAVCAAREAGKKTLTAELDSGERVRLETSGLYNWTYYAEDHRVINYTGADRAAVKTLEAGKITVDNIRALTHGRDTVYTRAAAEALEQAAD